MFFRIYFKSKGYSSCLICPRFRLIHRQILSQTSRNRNEGIVGNMVFIHRKIKKIIINNKGSTFLKNTTQNAYRVISPNQEQPKVGLSSDSSLDPADASKGKGVMCVWDLISKAVSRENVLIRYSGILPNLSDFTSFGLIHMGKVGAGSG